MNEQPAGPSSWDTATEQAPGGRRGIVIGCLALVALLVIAIVGVVLLTPFPRGFGAAIAIVDHGKPEVVGANYSVTSTGASMQVTLARGVAEERAHQIGCGLVRDELARAQLTDTSWVVMGATGVPLSNSSTICP